MVQLEDRASNRSMRLQKIRTPNLHLAYEDSGPKNGEPLLMLHGWPDSPRTWDKVLPELHAAGYRTLAPYIRGYGETTYRDRILGRSPRRTGQPVAFAQDMIDLADRLKLQRFHFVGHDWGARTAHALAALFPRRLRSMVTISVPFEPGKAKPPKFPQDRAFWYQWFLCSIPGEKKFRKDPVAFGREQWDSWSPAGWYSQHDFAETAKSWSGDDFIDTVLHGYRSRWGHAALDPKYDVLQERFMNTRSLEVPTTLIHGADDACELQQTTEGEERYYACGYRRVLVEGMGHFPQRENPGATTAAILQHLRANG